MPKEKSPKINPLLYRKTSINNLILYSMYLLSARKRKCCFEDLLKECFSLFPKVFCLKNIPKWPDSRKLDRPLRTLRTKKLIKGGPECFTLTKKGEILASEIALKFKQKTLKL